MAGRWELTDEQWLIVEPVLRGARRADNRGRPRHDTRAVLNGALSVFGTGAQSRELPKMSAITGLPSPFPAMSAQRELG